MCVFSVVFSRITTRNPVIVTDFFCCSVVDHEMKSIDRNHKYFTFQGSRFYAIDIEITFNFSFVTLTRKIAWKTAIVAFLRFRISSPVFSDF